jgi:hypothetical protein
MKLIDLYVAEVGRHLPEKQREDIQNEVRSAIEDALEDEARAQGKAPDEVLAAGVLKRFGPPEKTAASYLPPRYLIGPELYPQFIKTVGVVASLGVLVWAIVFGVSLGTSAQARADIVPVLFQAFGGLMNALFFGAAVVVWVFAVIQWTSRGLAGQPREWDPNQLKEQAGPDPDRIAPYELMIETVIVIAAILIFNLYPQWIGIYWFQNGHWLTAPVLGEAFFRYLPLMNLWWALQGVHNLILLAQRRWQPLTRWFNFGLNALRIAIFVQILFGPPVLNLDVSPLAGLTFPLPDPQTIASANLGLNTALRIGLGIATAVGAVNLVRELYRRLLSGRVRLADL